MKIASLSLLFSITFSLALTAQKADSNAINWLSWEEAMELSRQQEKKILLNVFTEWCGWCKRMDAETLSNPEVVAYINDNFYPVRLDAQRKDPLEYKGITYEFNNSGKRGYHELAAELLNGRMSFPSMVFLDESKEVIQSIVGFKKPKDFQQILAYFGDNHYRDTPWSVFQRSYGSNLPTDKKEDK